jgi:Uma2 family endonuclease
VHPEPADLYDEMIPLPRRAVRFPLELRPPSRFRHDDAATWPKLAGRLEYVEGRLLLMPPCGDVQQDVAMSVASVLESWAEEHPDWVAGGNEAGMLLGGDVRGADGALWRRGAVLPRTGGYRRSPPDLAVEVAGQDESEPELRDKARWYLDHGVKVVWLVLPETREVLVLSSGAEHRCRAGERLPVHPELPGLEPSVDRLFRQLDR